MKSKNYPAESFLSDAASLNFRWLSLELKAAWDLLNVEVVPLSLSREAKSFSPKNLHFLSFSFSLGQMLGGNIVHISLVITHHNSACSHGSQNDL